MVPQTHYQCTRRRLTAPRRSAGGHTRVAERSRHANSTRDLASASNRQPPRWRLRTDGESGGHADILPSIPQAPPLARLGHLKSAENEKEVSGVCCWGLPPDQNGLPLPRWRCVQGLGRDSAVASSPCPDRFHGAAGLLRPTENGRVLNVTAEFIHHRVPSDTCLLQPYCRRCCPALWVPFPWLVSKDGI